MMVKMSVILRALGSISEQTPESWRCEGCIIAQSRLKIWPQGHRVAIHQPDSSGRLPSVPLRLNRWAARTRRLSQRACNFRNIPKQTLCWFLFMVTVDSAPHDNNQWSQGGCRQNNGFFAE
jgi:hypothetical protein